ncbi:MAG: hypothetical protein NVS3B21_18640 [Acidimicrobiales bacterium]
MGRSRGLADDPPRRRAFRLGRALLVGAALCGVGACGAAGSAPQVQAARPRSAAGAAILLEPWAQPLRKGAGEHLQPGSNPAALPGDLLIADKLNNRLIIVDPQGHIRWEFPRRGDLAPGQTFKIPDDAFFSTDGTEIVATEEDDQVIRLINVATHRITYTYGKPGEPGSGPNRVWNPDDAVMLPGRQILTADIKNQRLLLIAPGAHRPEKIFGATSSGYHDPPTSYGAPNGVFPIGNGQFLVTEIRGDWVDDIDLHGHVFWSTHVPGFSYPSDSNRIGSRAYLSVDYAKPGQAVIFNRYGQTLWRFAPRGAQELNHPSLALPLPNGDIVLNDDYNHRVIVIDRRSHRVIWQYGHTGIPGRAPGYLDNPDGLDLVPPNGLIERTMGMSTR